MPLNEHYDLDTDAIVSRIRESGAKRVLLQLPDGLKMYGDELQAAVASSLPDVEIVFWGGTAFGSCDVPLQVKRLGFDLIVHLGHAPWR